MIPEKDWEMYEAMKKYGGSFVVALAEVLARADSSNYSKLENAFPEYFAQYREMGVVVHKTN